MGNCTEQLELRVAELLDRVRRLEQRAHLGDGLVNSLPSPPTTADDELLEDPLDDIGATNLTG